MSLGSISHLMSIGIIIIILITILINNMSIEVELINKVVNKIVIIRVERVVKRAEVVIRETK